jgi:hypothetical protein
MEQHFARSSRHGDFAPGTTARGDEMRGDDMSPDTGIARL